MKVKIKKTHKDAVIPEYSRQGDAGLDLTAISRDWKYSDGGGYYEYGTGLSIEIPEGFVGLIFPRSSQSNVNQLLTNHVGVIDSNYRGEIKFRFKSVYQTVTELNEDFNIYKTGDRIGQLIIIPYPPIEFEEVDELSETIRGDQGFGSSGN
jgi:dUTP pyrophosphatase